ncbi:MAG: histidine kinase [Acidobacteriota bacterium]|nr:histidine kinase [Acidobacteriota bacterium]
MVYVSLVSLFVYLFGAYAYGAATVLGLREALPFWSRRDRVGQSHLDNAPMAIIVISTIWFILHTLIEFRNLTGNVGRDWLDVGTFMVYAFPPVIMQAVYQETSHSDDPPPRIYRQMLLGMFVLSPLVGAVTIAAIFRVITLPFDIGPLIGTSIGSLFVMASAYSTAIMMRRKRTTPTSGQRQLRTVMVALYAVLGIVFIAMMFLQEQRVAMGILERVARSSPLYFLIASVYFENRFAFYDLVVKRALLLLMSIGTLGVVLALAMPWLDRLPISAARPWLFAVALTPVAMIMPWLHARMERWLDRIWLGREFTPVDAVKYVLAAMQPATDEQMLLTTAEAKLSEIFGARIAVLIGAQSPPPGLTIESEVQMPTPISDQPVRIAVLRMPEMRRILSEDLALLRSLAGVLGFMLENLRLQRKRQEQDLIAQDLRLQSSKSELKALRAQINPHFLFNALNAIASLIHTDPARADEAVEQLAEVFRYTLRRSDSEWAPLDQELTFARAYLDVEQARFGQRLSCTIDSDHVAPAPSVPSMLLQTLLENAVKHGVSQSREPGRIEVIVRTTSSEVKLEVRNTGPSTRGDDLLVAAPRSGQAREGEGFGLRSVRERLKGHFGDAATFALTRDEAAGLTIARITMPHVKVAA